MISMSRLRIWLHQFGLHWWYEDLVTPKGARKPMDIRYCLVCPKIQRLERNYNPNSGHWYAWVTVTDGWLNRLIESQKRE